MPRSLIRRLYYRADATAFVVATSSPIHQHISASNLKFLFIRKRVTFPTLTARNVPKKLIVTKIITFNFSYKSKEKYMYFIIFTIYFLSLFSVYFVFFILYLLFFNLLFLFRYNFFLSLIIVCFFVFQEDHGILDWVLWFHRS